jgi:choline dehydrogenase-like flavoprotein
LKDHPSFTFTVKRSPASLSTVPGPEAGLISRILRWSSSPDEHGDLQALVLDQVNVAGPGEPTYAAVVVGLMRVDGRGLVEPGPAGSGDPRVVTGAFADAGDRRRFRQAVLDVAELLASGSMDPVVDEVFVDDRGTTVEHLADLDDHALDRFLADHPGPYAHPAASCPMGPADDRWAVVASDPDVAGKVRGVEGLYAADASIFPDLVQGGLQVPVAAVAARIAAAIAAG